MGNLLAVILVRVWLRYAVLHQCILNANTWRDETFTRLVNSIYRWQTRSRYKEIVRMNLHFYNVSKNDHARSWYDMRAKTAMRNLTDFVDYNVCAK